MAFRLKLVPAVTHINFFRWRSLTTGSSVALMIVSVILLLTMGLNYGIDFRGGTTIRAESSHAFDVGDYRAALEPVVDGDLSITEVFDPTFGDRNVVQIRLGAQQDAEAVTQEEPCMVARIRLMEDDDGEDDPEMQALIKSITMKLEDNERGNITRLMKVKEMMQ